MNRLIQHIRHFCPIWALLGLLGVATLFALNNDWSTAKILAWVSLGVFALFMVLKPMNIVYGLIGTTGNIQIYIAILILFNLLFSFIYFFSFFQNAGISYDLSQPYISYNIYGKLDNNSIIFAESTICDTTYIHTSDNLTDKSFFVTREVCRFQPISFQYVFKNTLLTSLIQEPSGFFVNASNYCDIPNYQIKDTDVYLRYCEGTESCELYSGIDEEKSDLFNWLLILQIFISWIFFGVFISILYNKFRLES